MRVIKNGNLISSVEDWLLFAPPKKGEMQWRDGRSAKELAKAFLPRSGRALLPNEISDLLQTHPEFAGFFPEEAWPERAIRLDDLRGETRNTDLLLLGANATGRIALSIEAKADESFGPTIEERIRQARRTPKSMAESRVRRLMNAVLGEDDLEEVGDLRYQLLHSTAAAVIAAQDTGCDRGMMLVYEFSGSQTDPKRAARNAEDLSAFVRALGSEEQSESGKVGGPFNLPGDEFVPSGLPLYIGKVVRQLRNQADASGLDALQG